MIHVAQSMLDEGHEVEFLDLNACRMSKDQFLDKISKLDLDLVGIGGLVTVYSQVKWITNEIKNSFVLFNL